MVSALDDAAILWIGSTLFVKLSPDDVVNDSSSGVARGFKESRQSAPPLYLEGVVRGFRESRQSGGYNFFRNAPNPDVIVWTFQLERHSETGERLDLIPVEMRGKSFSGFINEGNVVRLYEKSWQGGIVRPWRVYNVTFKDDIKAYG